MSRHLNIVKEKVDYIRSNSNIIYKDSFLPSYGIISLKNAYYVKYCIGYYSLWGYDNYRPYEKKSQSIIIRTKDLDTLVFYVFWEATKLLVRDYSLNHIDETYFNRTNEIRKIIEVMQSLGFEQRFIDVLRSNYGSVNNTSVF